MERYPTSIWDSGRRLTSAPISSKALADLLCPDPSSPESFKTCEQSHTSGWALNGLAVFKLCSMKPQGSKRDIRLLCGLEEEEEEWVGPCSSFRQNSSVFVYFVTLGFL